jgi:hypothetical protein
MSALNLSLSALILQISVHVRMKRIVSQKLSIQGNLQILLSRENPEQISPPWLVPLGWTTSVLFMVLLWPRS